jgi:hypothetical protein
MDSVLDDVCFFNWLSGFAITQKSSAFNNEKHNLAANAKTVDVRKFR